MQNAALTSATKHAKALECEKWGAKCLNTTLPLFILVHAGFSVKLYIKNIHSIKHRISIASILVL